MNIPLVLWTLASILGLLLSAWLVRESWLDVQALSGESNGRLRAARSRLIRETVRAFVHTGYLHASLIATFGLWPGTGWIVWILIFGNLALVFNSTVDYRMRPALWQYRSGDDGTGRSQYERPEEPLH